MSRSLWIAAGGLVVAVVAWFALVDTDRGRVVPMMGDAPLDGDRDAAYQSEVTADAVEENTSNRAASDDATDDAFESARSGEEPVQGTLDTTGDVNGAAGALAPADFTVEGFDRDAVLQAIEASDLEEPDKEHLVELLADAEQTGEDLDAALASVRAALEIGA